MANIIHLSNVEDSIISIDGKDVIIDSEVATLYGVETKRINEAVKNNPEKFPSGYVIELTAGQVESLRSKFSTLKTGGRGEHSKYLPKAFTEKGLYMLATILKGPKAVATTISIIEAFAKLRELSRTIGAMTATSDASKQKSLLQKSGEIVDDLFGEDMQTTDTATEIELNFAVLKFRHTIKRKK